MGLFDIIKKLFEWLFRTDSDGRTTNKENREYDDDGYKRLKTITDIKEKITDKIKDKGSKKIMESVFEFLELTQQNNSSNKSILSQVIRSITREAIIEYTPDEKNLNEITNYEQPVKLNKDMDDVKKEKNPEKLKKELTESINRLESVTEKKKDYTEEQIKILEQLADKSNMVKSNAGKIGDHVKFIKNRKTIALNKISEELKQIKELTKDSSISKLMELINKIQDELINEFATVKSTNYLIDAFNNSLTTLGDKELTNEVELNSNQINKEKRELLTKEYDSLNKIIDQIQDKMDFILKINKEKQPEKIGTDEEKLTKEASEIQQETKESEKKEQQLKNKANENTKAISENVSATAPMGAKAVGFGGKDSNIQRVGGKISG